MSTTTVETIDEERIPYADETPIVDDKKEEEKEEEVKKEDDKKDEEVKKEDEKKNENGEIGDDEEEKRTSKEGDQPEQKAQKMDDDDVITTARTSRRICGSAASSSDSETADDAPLLPDEGPSQPVRIDIPGGDKPASPHDRFPKTPYKTLVAFAMLVVAAATNTITLAWIHEKYPDTAPLPDLVFEHLPYIPEGLQICEKLMLGSFISVLILIFFHRHRWIVFRRLCFIGSILYFMRSVTMAVTQVPVADVNWKCAPRLGENATFGAIILRGLSSMIGLGLNIVDKEKVSLCGDYIYSGHTLVLVISALFMNEYSPRRFHILHYLSWLVAGIGVVFLVLSHGHYTLDVILSYFVCTRVFWMYHTQAAHPTLRASVQNHHVKDFWFPLLRWFEADIRRPVPRRFDAPITHQQVCRFFRNFRQRRNNRHAIE